VGDTLATLVEEVQYELDQVVSPAAGQNFREHIKNRIRREYRRLYHDFDWPDLRQWTDRGTSAGQRYYNWPTGLSLATVSDVFILWGDRYHKLERGIDPCHYNEYNSDQGARMDPTLRWSPYGQAQLEIWPIPASASSLRFVGRRAFTPLVDEDDRCDLDTDLVVLFAAAKLAKTEDRKVQLLAEAQAHYKTLKQRLTRGNIRINFAKDYSEDPRHFGAPMPYVAVAEASVSGTATYAVFFPDFPGASEFINVDVPLSFTAGIDYSSASAEQAATDAAVFTITADGEAVGTVTFGPGETEGVFAFTNTTVPEDASLKFAAPATPDATLQDISITLGGTR